MKNLTIILSLLVIMAFLPSVSNAACTVTVQPTGKIQTAIDNGQLGDTICLAPGTYKEQIILTPGITLQGNELARTIIEGDGTGRVITAADSTTLLNITIQNGTIGLSLSGNTGVTLNNMIFVLNKTAISCSNSIVVTLTNSVIDRNTSAGLILDNSEITISNTILSNNTPDILFDVATILTLDHNLLFLNDPANYPTPDPSSIFGQDPLFVDPSSNDYHLKSGSPAINAGKGTDADGSAADIGAYGGLDLDPTPFPVSDITATRVDDSTMTVSWSADLAYNISGYKIFFDSDASGAPYNGTSAQGNSPVDAGNVTTFTLSGLPGPAPDTAPVGLSTAPGNGKLYVSWSALQGAQGYTVHYGAASGSYPNTIEVGKVTSVVIDNLTNNVTYFIAVSASFETTYFVSVSAVDTLNHESLPVNESSVVLKPGTEGPLSAEVSDFPEETVPFPDLKDENRCFIATAAYGSSTESEVMILRKFRNHFLLTNAPGRKLVAFYYSVSPRFAEYLNAHARLKPFVRLSLIPFIALAKFCLNVSPTQTFVLLLLIFLFFGSLFVMRRRRLQ